MHHLAHSSGYSFSIACGWALTASAMLRVYVLCCCSYDGSVTLLGNFEDSTTIYIVQEMCGKVRHTGWLSIRHHVLRACATCFP